MEAYGTTTFYMVLKIKEEDDVAGEVESNVADLEADLRNIPESHNSGDVSYAIEGNMEKGPKE